jgi:putative Mg2+ transporter-C (MgtC) family protein
MEHDFFYDIIKIAVAFALGALLGIEREYKKKPAGFRTMIMITVGAALFTTLSSHIAGNPDRIAANIITGIGFIGAGVIFKEGVKVSGMTTAATIWISAAIGMAVGYGAFYLATAVALLMLFTLVLLEQLEFFFERFHQVVFYKITFLPDGCTLDELEKKFNEFNIRFIKDDQSKINNQIIVFYQLTARKYEFQNLNDFLLKNQAIVGFET